MNIEIRSYVSRNRLAWLLDAEAAPRRGDCVVLSPKPESWHEEEPQYIVEEVEWRAEANGTTVRVYVSAPR